MNPGLTPWANVMSPFPVPLDLQSNGYDFGICNPIKLKAPKSLCKTNPTYPYPVPLDL